MSRLAPSPTGALHLGNARTFLVNWALARQGGWRLVMRIEDLDGPRVKPEAVTGVLDTLAWLGIDWDGEVLVQSTDLDPYRLAMRKLADAGLVYKSNESRKEIEQAASAPHQGDHEVRFGAELRPTDQALYRFDDETSGYRLVVDDRELMIDDAVMGRQVVCPAKEVGDFVVWTKRGTPAYQLAVVVDDARQGVTDVVRGDDLLPSAGRQRLLYEALGLREPQWWHLPLVLGPDGKRLAKRHGDTRVDAYRKADVPPERVIGLLAWWCGATDELGEMTAEGFLQAFDVTRLKRTPITFGEDDDRWLRQKC